jgi:N-acetylmuramate 1-kinase
MQEALTRLAPVADVLSLRDYHAENLIWRPDRTGLDRVGLLDFQDAFLAPAEYDLVSLLRDARRDVSDPVREALIADFAAATGREAEGVGAAVAALGVQRNLRILGIFSRLARRDGKARYLGLLPRVLTQLRADLAHDGLTELRSAVLPLLDRTEIAP